MECRPRSLFLLLGACAVPGCAQSATELYVARNGNDGGSGARAHPFATLERARDEIRRRHADGALSEVIVYVRGGVYELPRTLQITAQDSGRAGAPVVWRSYRGERVTLSGAVAISGFQAFRGGIFKADASGFRATPFRQLYYQGRRQNLARYPNFDGENPYGGGWAYADGKPVPMYQEVAGEDKHTLVYKPADARAWAHPEDGEVMVFPRYNWWNNIVRIRSIDRGQRIITLAGNCSYPVRPGDRYYVQGMFEELDAPGEWYFDTRTGALYFWPPGRPGGRLRARAPALQISAPRLRTILELGAGTEYVVFRGFTFEQSAGTAITLSNTRHCLIAGNIIRQAGDYNGAGVVVNGGAHNGVVGNDIYETGSHGISISGGDRISLAPAENYADNNYIHHTGVFYKQGVGISLTGCGNRASHNLIHDTPRMAIMFSGNNLVIEYNHLRHLNLETADTGAVYTGGRDWISSRGTVIRYNYMHDSLGYGQENGRWMSPHYSWGVYLDDNTGGVDVVGNIVARAYRGLIHLHNGRDNLVENNIFVDGKLQQAEFNGWTDSSRMWRDHLPTMIQGYNAVKNQPAWSKMRNIETGPENAVLAGGLIMSGNVFRRNIVSYADAAAKLFSSRNLPLDQNVWERNVYWHAGLPLKIAVGGKAGEWDFGAWTRAGQDPKTLVADPRFVDARGDDYRLRPDSPAFQLGFEPIPLEKIGPYQDELRASWPIVEATGVREQPIRSR
jgi:parallel beta helix pectate lyase-like protein